MKKPFCHSFEQTTVDITMSGLQWRAAHPTTRRVRSSLILVSFFNDHLYPYMVKVYHLLLQTTLLPTLEMTCTTHTIISVPMSGNVPCSVHWSCMWPTFTTIHSKFVFLSGIRVISGNIPRHGNESHQSGRTRYTMSVSSSTYPRWERTECDS